MDFLELMRSVDGGQVEKTRGLFANFERLDEAATTYSPSTGNLTITVIKPGWSKNNRYYSPALLKGAANIFEGAKMFMDHATDKEASQRPEGSVRDWVGTITGVKAESDGTIKATANIHNEAFKTSLANLKKAGNLNQMGVSIRAFGEAKPGEAEGRKGTVVESLLGCKSVDFVTFAGAGGQVESMSESVTADDLKIFTEADPVTKKKLVLVESLKARGMSEAEARGTLGLEPKLPEGLTRLQEAEYTFAIRCGSNPDAALKLAKLAGPVRPHARF